jgi:hypothetical protein
MKELRAIDAMLRAMQNKDDPMHTNSIDDNNNDNNDNFEAYDDLEDYPFPLPGCSGYATMLMDGDDCPEEEEPLEDADEPGDEGDAEYAFTLKSFVLVEGRRGLKSLMVVALIASTTIHSMVIVLEGGRGRPNSLSLGCLKLKIFKISLVRNAFSSPPSPSTLKKLRLR